MRGSVAQNTSMNSAAELPALSAEHGLIRFEQPLSERMRTFLRIEFLYEQLLFHVDEPTGFGSRAAITVLLEILTILGRGDVRADVSKELERHASPGRAAASPVDPARPRGSRQHRGPASGSPGGAADVNPLKECD